MLLLVSLATVRVMIKRIKEGIIFHRTLRVACRYSSFLLKAMIFFTYFRLLLEINDEAENGRVEKHGEHEPKETTACFFLSLYYQP